MKKIYFALLLLMGLLFTSCTSTDVQNIKVVQQNITKDNSTDVKKIVFKELVNTITDKGFEIKNIYEDTGIINTEWRQVKNEGGGQAFQILFVDMSVKVKRYISLSIKVEDSYYKVKAQAKATQTSGLRNSSKDEFKELSEDEMKFIEDILSTVNKKVGLQNNFSWQIESII